jgi:hypothetical protein
MQKGEKENNVEAWKKEKENLTVAMEAVQEELATAHREYAPHPLLLRHRTTHGQHHTAQGQHHTAVR